MASTTEAVVSRRYVGRSMKHLQKVLAVAVILSALVSLGVPGTRSVQAVAEVRILPGMELVPAKSNAQSSTSTFEAGFSVLAYGNAPDFEENTDELLDRLSDLGVTSVSFVFPVFQRSWTATEVYADGEHTPTEANIIAFSRAAHKRGLSVMLRPILDEESLLVDSQWRGTLQPTDRAAWFASYGSLMLDYARFAEDEGIESLSIGTEFLSLEKETTFWIELISEVRSVFSGRVSYSYNWDAQDLGFAGSLDYVGIDAFFPLHLPPDATVYELVRAWQPWLDTLWNIQHVTGKDVILTEVGTRSEAGSYQAPWVWEGHGPPSQEDQANYFEATCALVMTPAARGERRPFDGMYVWAADLNQGVAISPVDTGFTPLTKKAESVIEECYRALAGS